MGKYECEGFEFFKGGLTDHELTHMKETMEKTIMPMHKAWRDAGSPVNGVIAETYYKEVIRHINRYIIQACATLNNSNTIVNDIRDTVIRYIKNYYPRVSEKSLYTPLDFSMILIQRERREYYCLISQETIYYNQRRTDIDIALKKAGKPEGIKTPGLTVTEIHTITGASLTVISAVLNAVNFLENMDSLEEFQERGVKEINYLTEQTIGEDPYDKADRNFTSQKVHESLAELDILTRDILKEMYFFSRTSCQIRKKILSEKEKYEKELNDYCKGHGYKSCDKFSGNDVEAIANSGIIKLQSILPAKLDGVKPVNEMDLFEDFEEIKETTPVVSIDDLEEFDYK